MKKTVTLAAAALFLTVGAMKLSAKVDKHYYGFITSCGVDVCLEFPFEVDDEFCVVYLDNLEDLYCN